MGTTTGGRRLERSLPSHLKWRRGSGWENLYYKVEDIIKAGYVRHPGGIFLQCVVTVAALRILSIKDGLQQ